MVKEKFLCSNNCWIYHSCGWREIAQSLRVHTLLLQKTCSQHPYWVGHNHNLISWGHAHTDTQIHTSLEMSKQKDIRVARVIIAFFLWGMYTVAYLDHKVDRSPAVSRAWFETDQSDWAGPELAVTVSVSNAESSDTGTEAAHSRPQLHRRCCGRRSSLRSETHKEELLQWGWRWLVARFGSACPLGVLWLGRSNGVQLLKMWFLDYQQE